MRHGPSQAAEAILAILVPPACREEVLGDLSERYQSPLRYAWDALQAVPMVIASRIRRTTDPQVLLMQAFAQYLSFLGAAWLQDRALLSAPWGLVRLAIPAAMALLGIVLEDAYTMPGRPSPRALVRGPAVGFGLALFSQAVLWGGRRNLVLPPWILLYGCAMSLLLSTAIRMLFPPPTGRLHAAGAPADWLKQVGGGDGLPQGLVLALKGIAGIVTAAAIGTWMSDEFAVRRPTAIAAVWLLFLAFQLWTRA